MAHLTDAILGLPPLAVYAPVFTSRRGPSLILLGIFILLMATITASRWFIRHESQVRQGWQRYLARPRVARFHERHRRQIAFIGRRLSPNEILGLYLTIGAGVSLSLGWAFAAVTQDVATGDEIARWDAPIADFVSLHRSPELTVFMKAFTHLGGAPVIMGILLIGILVTIRKSGNSRAATFLTASVAGGYVLDTAFKFAVHRVRPGDALAQSLGYSFPSGHTVAAVVMFGGLAFALTRIFRTWRIRVWSWTGAFLISITVAISRVYLGVHHATDVIAGAVLGAMWLGASATSWMVWDRLGTSSELRKIRRRVASRIVRGALLAASLGIIVQVLLLSFPGIRSSASALRRLNPAFVILAVLLEIIANLALAQVYRSTITILGGQLGYREGLRTSMGMFTIGHILPGGGATAGLFAARRYRMQGVPAATATTTVILAGVLAMTTLSVIVAAGAIGSLFRGDLPAIYVWFIGSLLVGFVLASTLVVRAIRSDGLRDRIFATAQKVARRFNSKATLENARRSFDSVAGNIAAGPRRLFPIVGWSALNWVSDSAALYVLFLGFGHRIHIGVLLVGFGIANLASALPITPGGLGLAEAGMAGIYTAFGPTASVAVVTVLSYRLLSYWLPVIAGVPAYVLGSRESRRMNGERSE